MASDTSPNSTSPSNLKTASRWRKPLLTIIALGMCFIGVLFLSRGFWLPGLLDYLDVSQPPQPADVLVILGGNGSRARTAVDLYNQRLASRVILGGCSASLEMQLAYLEKEGVPSSAIVATVDAESTWDEAKQVLDLLQTDGATSALIITDSYHTRRARATYAHMSAKMDIELTFVSSSDTLSSENWWRNGTSRWDVLSEYPKLVYYLLRYGVTPWEN